jgi:hypothetical protein
MSKNERNEALWRLAVEIEAKENAPASQRDCNEVQELRKRFDALVHQKSRKAGGLQEGD